MPLPVRALALLVAPAPLALLALAPATAPCWHPAGLDWLALASWLALAPTLLALACVPGAPANEG